MKSYTAKIFVGLQEGYSGKHHYIAEAWGLIQKYVDRKEWCVRVTETMFIYKEGREKGIEVTAIQYPRFPLDVEEIKKRTLELANILMVGLDQNRVSVELENEIFLLEV